MNEPVRARDVQVAHVYQARCLLCAWSGELMASYPEANTEREDHLASHRTAWSVLRGDQP